MCGGFIGDVLGGVGDLVGGVADAVGDLAGGVVDAVGSAIEKVGDTITSIVEDPKKLAMVAISTFAPGVGTAVGSAIGLTGTAAAVVGNTLVNTALNGGDVKSALLASAIPIVGKEAAQLAADSFVNAGFDTAMAQTAGKLTAQTGMAAATGRDPLQALISGGLQEAIPTVTGEIEGFSDMSPRVQAAVNRAIGTTLLGGDPSMSLINAAISAGQSAASTEQAAEKREADTSALDALLAKNQDEWTPDDWAKLYAFDTAGVSPSNYPVQDLGNTSLFWNEYQTNLQDIVDKGGFTSQWVPDDAGHFTLHSDDGSTITVDSMGNVLGVTSATDTKYTPPTAGAAKINLPVGQIVSTLTGQNANLQQQLTQQQQQAAQQQQQQGFMNLLMLAGLSDAQQVQQQPVQVQPADVKSFEEQGYGELFGPQLSFAEGGDVQALIDLLRG